MTFSLGAIICQLPVNSHVILAFPPVFEKPLPAVFTPSCHIFYSQRVVDVNDDLPKYLAHKGKSILLENDGSAVKKESN